MTSHELTEPVPAVFAWTLTNQLTCVKTADSDFCDLAVVLLPCLNVDTDEHYSIFLEREWHWLRDINDIEIFESIVGSLLCLSFCPSCLTIVPRVYDMT